MHGGTPLSISLIKDNNAPTDKHAVDGADSSRQRLSLPLCSETSPQGDLWTASGPLTLFGRVSSIFAYN